jgi:hypothetical protein
MNYNIEADWHLLDTCNYRCDYCFFGPETLGSKLRTFASPEGWKSAFDATGDVWLLHMTGGEPSTSELLIPALRGSAVLGDDDGDLGQLRLVDGKCSAVDGDAAAFNRAERVNRRDADSRHGRLKSQVSTLNAQARPTCDS